MSIDRLHHLNGAHCSAVTGNVGGGAGWQGDTRTVLATSLILALDEAGRQGTSPQGLGATAAAAGELAE